MLGISSCKRRIALTTVMTLLFTSPTNAWAQKTSEIASLEDQDENCSKSSSQPKLDFSDITYSELDDAFKNLKTVKAHGKSFCNVAEPLPAHLSASSSLLCRPAAESMEEGFLNLMAFADDGTRFAGHILNGRFGELYEAINDLQRAVLRWFQLKNDAEKNENATDQQHKNREIFREFQSIYSGLDSKLWSNHPLWLNHRHKLHDVFAFTQEAMTQLIKDKKQFVKHLRLRQDGMFYFSSTLASDDFTGTLHLPSANRVPPLDINHIPSLNSPSVVTSVIKNGHSEETSTYAPTHSILDLLTPYLAGKIASSVFIEIKKYLPGQSEFIDALETSFNPDDEMQESVAQYFDEISDDHGVLTALEAYAHSYSRAVNKKSPPRLFFEEESIRSLKQQVSSPKKLLGIGKGTIIYAREHAARNYATAFFSAANGIIKFMAIPLTLAFTENKLSEYLEDSWGFKRACANVAAHEIVTGLSTVPTGNFVSFVTNHLFYLYIGWNDILDCAGW